MARFAIAALVVSGLFALGCRSGSGAPGDPLDAPASPQASAVPAPLATLPTTAATPSAPIVASPDAAPPPVPLRPDAPAPADTLARDVAGYTLRAVLRPADPQAPSHAPEVSTAGLDAARKRTDAHLLIDLAPFRARFVVEGRGFVLPEGTEIRARADRYGHLLLLPNEPSYRVAASGSLRALLGERRLDVAPVASPDVTGSSEGARRLGYRTRKVDVVSRAGRATFELARVADAGEGGPLVCRFLLDLMSAPPSTPLCAADEVPLHAELHWATHGSIAFEAVSIVRRLDLGPSQLAAPPPTLTYAPGALPPLASDVLLSPQELGALHTGPGETGRERDPVHDKDPRGTLTLVNSGDELSFVWLDGVPVAWVAPGARGEVQNLYRGRYALEWRTFLGDVLEPARQIAVPGTSDSSVVDAGP